MAEKLSKDQLIDRIMDSHDRLEEVLEMLSETQMLQPGVIGEWSVKDILAHLMEWDRRFILWYDTGLQGIELNPPEEGYTWEQLDEVNRLIYNLHRDKPLVDVLAGYRSSYMTVLVRVGMIQESDLDRPGLYRWLQGGTLLGFINADTWDHYDWARNGIAAWMQNQSATAD
jgi:hypothetical protein